MSYGAPRRGGGASSRTTLFVAGFPPDMRARDLAYEFERMGPLVRCDIPAIRNPNAKPYAFVEYEDPRDAEEAHRRMHNMRFGDFTIGIQFAKAAPSSSWRYDGGGRAPPPRARSPPRRYDDRRDDRDRDYRRDDRRDDRDRDYRRRDDRDRDYRRDDRDGDRDRRDDRDDRAGSSRPRSLSPRRPSSRSPPPRDNGERADSRPPADDEAKPKLDNGNHEGGDEDAKTGWE